VGRGIVIDYGAGGILFARQEVASCAGGVLVQESGTAPSGAYTVPQHITFLHSILERQTSNTASPIEVSAGNFIYFENSITTGKDNSDTSAMVKVSGSATVTLRNMQINTQAVGAKYLSLTGSATVYMQGRIYLIGGASRPTYDLDVPAGTHLYVQGDVTSSANNYQITFTPATSYDQTVAEQVRTVRFVSRNATGDNVMQGALYSDAGFRFRLLASGQLGWMDGTSFTPDTFIQRAFAGAVGVKGALVPNATNTYDMGQTTNVWKTLYLGSAVVVGKFATGSRPSASTLGQGAMVLDSTLNKPIWSDGTNWRDATGTVV
jgi:hypothetical protein